MNSILQVLFSLPEFQEEYFGKGPGIIHSSPIDPTESFTVQMFVHGRFESDQRYLLTVFFPYLLLSPSLSMHFISFLTPLDLD
jgi:hypothetical protein